MKFLKIKISKLFYLNKKKIPRRQAYFEPVYGGNLDLIRPYDEI